MLVAVEDDRLTLALGNRDRGYLVLEAPSLHGGDRPALRLGGIGILRLAAQAVFLREVLGGDAHVAVVEGVPQAIVDHAVEHLRMPHAQAAARAGQQVGGEAHVFLAAGDDHLGVAATDRLDGQMHGLEAGAADLVQGQRWRRHRQACGDRRLARRILSDTSR